MPIKTMLLDSAGLETNSLVGSDKTLLDDCENVFVTPEGDLVGRRGFQKKINQTGGYGVANYTYSNSNNTAVEEIILFDTTVSKVSEGYITIGYSGSETHITVSVSVVSGVMRLKVLEGASTLLNRSLGQGYEESSSDTVTAAAAAVDALANITCSVTGTGSVSSAFLDITDGLHIPSGQSKTIKFLYPTTVNSPATYPLFTLEANKGTSKLRNVSSVSFNNLLFAADGGLPHVYDGQNLYYAGLPDPVVPSYSTTSGTLTGTYTYYITYQQVDARGKITESNLSEPLEVVTSQQGVNLTLKTLYKTSGYNTNCAIVNGSQVASPSSGLVTLTVDDGVGGAGTLRAGDWATLYNSTTGIASVQSYEISSVSSTTITVVSSDTITVSDNDVISNGLTINIYKSFESESARYLVKELPNNSFDYSIQYSDNPAQAVIDGAQQVVPSNGQVTFTIDAGSSVLVGDILAVFNHHPDVGATQYLEVLSISGTTLTLKSTEDVYVIDNQQLIVDISTYPILTEYQVTQGPPPEADYCISYKGNLILAKGYRLYYSDDINSGFITSSQSFPPTYVIGFPRPITALAVSGDFLYVGMDNRIEAIVSSALDSAPYNRLLVTDEMGMSSHSGYVVRGDTVYFVSDGGIYSMSGGKVSPIPISWPINHVFTDINLNAHNAINLKRSVAVSDFINNRMLFYLPEESSSHTDFATSNSKTLVFDYIRGLWHIWTNFHLSGGALVYNRQLLFSERKMGASLRRGLNRVLDNKTNSDYFDHVEDIAASASFQWDILGSQNLGQAKKIKSVRIYSKTKSTETLPTQPAITLKIYKNLVEGLLHTNSTIEFDTPGWKWNEFLWGDQPIGSYQKAHKKIRSTALAVESIKLKLEANLSGSNFNCSAIEVDWMPEEENELKD